MKNKHLSMRIQEDLFEHLKRKSNNEYKSVNQVIIDLIADDYKKTQLCWDAKTKTFIGGDGTVYEQDGMNERGQLILRKIEL